MFKLVVFNAAGGPRLVEVHSIFTFLIFLFIPLTFKLYFYVCQGLNLASSPFVSPSSNYSKFLCMVMFFIHTLCCIYN